MLQIAQLFLAVDGSGQDRVLALRIESRAVLAVADGAGGRSGGAEASQMAMDFIRGRAAFLNTQSDCERLLRELDELIEKDRVAGETTAVVALVSGTGIVGASVGDSGAWIIGSSSVDDLTRAQIRKPFLGSGSASPKGFSRAAFASTLLLATDGLLKYAAQEAIVSAFGEQTLNSVAERLVGLVRYPSGRLTDDIGIVLCR